MDPREIARRSATFDHDACAHLGLQCVRVPILVMR
jgi:hypothetical protein